MYTDPQGNVWEKDSYGTYTVHQVNGNTIVGQPAPVITSPSGTSFSDSQGGKFYDMGNGTYTYQDAQGRTVQNITYNGLPQEVKSQVPAPTGPTPILKTNDSVNGSATSGHTGAGPDTTLIDSGKTYTTSGTGGTTVTNTPQPITQTAQQNQQAQPLQQADSQPLASQSAQGFDLSGLPAGNLQPGQTSNEVKQLQQWLINNGFNIPSGATGYYGPETKAAVTSLQSTLHVDTQGNPGYFGNLTRTALSQYAQPTQQQNGTSAATGTDYQTALNNLNNLGLTGQALTDAQNNLQQHYQSQPQTGTDQTGTTTPAFQPQSTGNPVLDQTLGALQNYLTQLEQKGQVLNPDIQITPEQVAQFTQQAQNEIDPYYKTQLSLARDNLLRGVGYSTDEIQRKEAEAERTYKQQGQQIASNAADQGFAQSGQRVLDEQNLAHDTQSSIDANRRQLSFDTGNAVAGFAEKYGGQNIPSFQIGNAPTVGAGESSFGKTPGTRSLYTLDPNVYQNLVGSQQFAQTGAVQNRASQLESAFRSNQAINQARQLTI